MELIQKRPWLGTGSDTQRALNAFAILTGLGGVAGIIFGLQYSTRGALLAVLASALGFALGGLAGFLFGFPRYTDPGAQDPRDAAPRTAAERAASGLRPNTNLERIVDWLMTMIIGATLVNIESLRVWASLRFAALTTEITGTTAGVNALFTAVPGTLLVVPFMITGFLFMYLWARRVLPQEWHLADGVLRGLQTLQAKQAVMADKVSKIEARVFVVEPVQLQTIESDLKHCGTDEATIADVLARYRKSSEWQDEPFAEFGPAASGGYEISATVKVGAVESRVNPYKVTLAVRRTDGAPAMGCVALLLHHTWNEPVLIHELKSDGWTEEILMSEAFVVGALVVPRNADGTTGQSIRLALDLASVPGVPAEFSGAR